MKIKFLQKSFIGTGKSIFPGEIHEVNDGFAKKLIARGVAEQVKRAKKKKAKLSNRSVKSSELVSPEE